jgi:hypothetical protein
MGSPQSSRRVSQAPARSQKPPKPKIRASRSLDMAARARQRKSPPSTSRSTAPAAAHTTEAIPSKRAGLIAKGLVRTERAAPGTKAEHGFLRLECFAGGFYWISFNGQSLLRGSTLREADELQTTFADAMERAGR